MNRHIFSGVVALSLALVGGVALAKGERSQPEAKARAEVMGIVAMNTKTLGDMAGGKAEFDAAKAEEAKAAIAAAAAAIPEAFKTEGAADPASEAKPEIWANWEDFLTKTKELETAALAMDASSLDGVRAGMGGVGGTCRTCHTSYRQ